MYSYYRSLIYTSEQVGNNYTPANQGTGQGVNGSMNNTTRELKEASLLITLLDDLQQYSCLSVMVFMLERSVQDGMDGSLMVFILVQFKSGLQERFDTIEVQSLPGFNINLQ